MFLNAVILILQEILEAALLISVMLCLTSTFNKAGPEPSVISLPWVFSAIAFGLAGAGIYAWATPLISTWFGYFGYEVVNAFLQTCMIGVLLLFCYVLRPHYFQARPARFMQFARACMISVVAISLVREVSEILLYMSGILGQPEAIGPVLLGGVIATGIGISSGIMLFQVLNSLPRGGAFRASMLLLALFAGNLAAQVVLLLTQADWLPYTPEVWNSSALLPESGIAGQLLYALVGYEANPSLAQASAYFAVVLLVLLSPVFRWSWQRGAVPR